MEAHWMEATGSVSFVTNLRKSRSRYLHGILLRYCQVVPVINLHPFFINLELAAAPL